VAPGSYVLEVLARDHVFDPLRVDVLESIIPDDTLQSSSLPSPPIATDATTSDDNNESLPPMPSSESPPSQALIQIRPAPLGTPFHPTHSPHFQALPLLPYPIVLNPRGQKIYVPVEKGFDIIAMFKNPMMMMMLLAGSMVFLMPKMLENMDPDLVKDMRGRQDKMFNLQNSLQNGDFSALTAELLRPPPAQESSKAKEDSGESRVTIPAAVDKKAGPSTPVPPASSASGGGGVKKISQTASGKKANAHGGKKKR